MARAATVEKALDVLFHLHASGTPLSLSEIGRDLDLPKSSCHRLLASLLHREIVEQDERGRYLPGLALLSLGLGAQAQEPVVRAARPVLEAEAASFGETVFLVARRRQRLRVLDKREGSGFLRAAPEVGDVVPCDLTAAGMLYRVFGTSDAAIGAVSEASSNAASDAASPGRGGPSDDSEEVRVYASGYATNRDAWIEGLSVLAVPIWQARAGRPRELVATLALGAASARFASFGEAAIAERLLAAADAIHERLGLRPARLARRNLRPQTNHGPGWPEERRS